MNRACVNIWSLSRLYWHNPDLEVSTVFSSLVYNVFQERVSKFVFSLAEESEIMKTATIRQSQRVCPAFHLICIMVKFQHSDVLLRQGSSGRSTQRSVSALPLLLIWQHVLSGIIIWQHYWQRIDHFYVQSRRDAVGGCIHGGVDSSRRFSWKLLSLPTQLWQFERGLELGSRVVENPRKRQTRVYLYVRTSLRNLWMVSLHMVLFDVM